ncbi:MAG: prohibitin family protein [Deltaproteobacteria bacterium]|nr:prohibitin family protein [Deltaproteobacteria bacterium]
MKNSIPVFLLMIVVALVMTGLNSCAKVESGEGGVLWTAFSGTQDESYAEGWYFVAPWNKMYTYDARTQDRPEDLHVLAKNGLSIMLQTSVRYRIKPDQVAKLHVTLGPEYYDVLMAPSIRSVAREVGGQFTPEEIYSTKRMAVEEEIYKQVTKLIADRPVILEAILVRNVDLPAKLKTAINEKLEEEQKALKMVFTLNKERQEAERKGIEAKGIANRNRIITESITEPFLRYMGIETTEKLAASPNAKIVVIGSGKDGLPLILGGN